MIDFVVQVGGADGQNVDVRVVAARLHLLGVDGVLQLQAVVHRVGTVDEGGGHVGDQAGGVGGFHLVRRSCRPP